MNLCLWKRHVWSIAGNTTAPKKGENIKVGAPRYGNSWIRQWNGQTDRDTQYGCVSGILECGMEIEKMSALSVICIAMSSVMDWDWIQFYYRKILLHFELIKLNLTGYTFLWLVYWNGLFPARHQFLESWSCLAATWMPASWLSTWYMPPYIGVPCYLSPFCQPIQLSVDCKSVHFSL